MTVIAFLPTNLSLTYSWATKINKSHTGVELQRICQRLYPLISVQVEYVLADGDSLATLRDLLFDQPGTSVEIPLRHEAVYVTANVTTTEVRVPQDGALDWTAVGRRIYVERDEKESDAVDGYGTTITGRTTSGADYVLTVDASPPSTYDASVTRACPLVTVYPDEGPGLGTYRIQGGNWTMSGRSSLFASLDNGLTAATFNSRTVIDTPFEHAGEPLTEEFESGVVVVGDAPFESVTYRAFGDIVRGLTFTGDSLTDWKTWKARLHALRGQQVTFLLPTWRADLKLILHVDTTHVRVDDVPDYALWFAAASHKHLMFQYSNGDIEYHTVTAVVDDGPTYTLTLGQATASAGTLTTISFLEVVRLASDDVTVNFGAGNRFDVSLQVRTVQQ